MHMLIAHAHFHRHRSVWRTGVVSIALSAISLSACAPAIANSLQIQPGATANSLAFVVLSVSGDSTLGAPVVGLSVVACGTEHVLWTIGTDGSRSMPRHVVYGATVPGYPTKTGPLPLTPGCYDVVMTGARRVRFDIDASGGVHVRTTTR
jgi:hypothetical protein